MGLLNLFGGDKKSETNYSTTNNLTDKSANAAEGSIAVAEGASVTIQDISAPVALESLRANRDVSQEALRTNRDVAQIAVAGQVATTAEALRTNRDVSETSINTTAALANSAINTLAGANKIASDERVDVLNSTNLALQSNQGLAEKFAGLAGAALERSQTPDSAVTKQLLWVVGAIVIGLVLIFSGKSRRTS